MLTTAVALRWLRLCKRVHLRAARLQRRDMDAKLRRLHLRRLRLAHRLRASGRHQDPNPEPKFREPGEWIPDRGPDDAERGFDELL